MRVRFPPRAHGMIKLGFAKVLFARSRESKDGVRVGERVGVARFFTRKILVTDSRPGHIMKKTLWIISNIFGYLFGERFLAPFYHALVNFGLHGLGYDNMYLEAGTGEEWFVKKILAKQNPKICLDIGANVGDFSALLLKYTKAKIYALEPSSSAFEKIPIDKENRLTKIKAAVADFDGEASLYSKGAHDPKASLDKNVRGGNEEKVSVLTVQSVAQKYHLSAIDFIKIDTEGYEKEVLKGLGTIRPQFIQFEFNIHHLYRNITLHELSQLLPEYNLYRLLPRSWIKIDPRKHIDNVFMFSNIVAVKK